MPPFIVDDDHQGAGSPALANAKAWLRDSLQPSVPVLPLPELDGAQTSEQTIIRPVSILTLLHYSENFVSTEEYGIHESEVCNHLLSHDQSLSVPLSPPSYSPWGRRHRH
jgi:hypothetical protein